MAAISVPTPLGYIIVSQSGNILCFQECEWANFCVIFEISSSNVMSNPDQCIFISNLLWWGSVLEQKTEAFCLFGKSGAMIDSQHSLRRANGKFEVLCLQSALESHVFKNLMRSQSRYLIENCELQLNAEITVKWGKNIVYFNLLGGFCTRSSLFVGTKQA